MEGPTFRARELMKQLNERPKITIPERDYSLDIPALIHNPELAYLNRHFGIIREVSRSKAGFLSRIKYRIRVLVARLVFGSLSDYFVAQQEFINHLVRLQNEVARSLDATIEQTNKTMVGTREALRLAEEAGMLHRLLEARIGKGTAESEP